LKTNPTKQELCIEEKTEKSDFI